MGPALRRPGEADHLMTQLACCRPIAGLALLEGPTLLKLCGPPCSLAALGPRRAPRSDRDEATAFPGGWWQQLSDREALVLRGLVAGRGGRPGSGGTASARADVATVDQTGTRDAGRRSAELGRAVPAG